MTPRDGHIRVLPLHVANKIAAGEVVERPASVVKELVENAIDAGAKNIKVTVSQGGRKLVAVQDDGCGMSRDDAVLSLERQATSKILDVGDIEEIDTLGYEGCIGLEYVPLLPGRDSLLETKEYLNICRSRADEPKITGGIRRDIVGCRIFNQQPRKKHHA